MISFPTLEPPCCFCLSLLWHYTKVEDVLKSVQLPNETLDMDLAQQAKVMCAILDIPTYSEVKTAAGERNPHLIESLHVLFTTYAEFKNNPFLQEGGGGGGGFNASGGFGGGFGVGQGESMTFD